MIAASHPVQRPPDAKLLVVDREGGLVHRARAEFVDLLQPGDVVIANDAATLPASLFGDHVPSHRPIEVRLAGRDSLALDEVRRFVAVVFGEGDFRTRTEDRPGPPPMHPGDRLILGGLRATVAEVLGHPRLIELEFEGTSAEIWEGLVRHGRPVQYAHLPIPLAVWDTWTSVAGPLVAMEAPSASFILDWRMIASIRARGAMLGTITHAAGLSSTGDAALDALLPFDEPYRIPAATASMIHHAKAHQGRVIAIGTTVVRALEHAAQLDGTVHAGEGLATQKINASTRLRVVDAILSGTHEPGTSHYELLRAFTDEQNLRRVDQELNAHNYLTHEFGDSVLIERRQNTR